MAFNIECVIEGCEFRKLDSGISKKNGNAWRSLKFEDRDGDNFTVSCSDSDLFYLTDNMRKGDMCDLTVRVIAGNDGQESSYSYIRLVNIELLEDEV